MFVATVDLRTGKAVIDGPNGILALAVDPYSDLDVVELGGRGVLRPGGLWQPQGRASSVNVARVRRTQGLGVRETSQMLVQVFEPGDVVVAPPKRVSKAYEHTIALVSGAPTDSYVFAVPFTGRRALRVSVLGPAGSIATVHPIGVCLDSQAREHLMVLSGTEANPTAGDTFTSSAAAFAGHALIDGVVGQSRLYGGTDSLEMADEVHFVAGADTTGDYHFLVEVADEVA